MNSTKTFTPGNPVNETIIAKRGDTFRPKGIVGYDKDGNPYDFTGHSFRLAVKKSPDGELLLTVPNENFTITQDADGIASGVNNVVDISHPKEDMDFETGKWVYDIEMTDAAGNTDTIYQGDFIFTKDVTT